MTTMNNPTINDMPIEVISHIVSFVESVNIFKEEYIDISPNGTPYFVKKNKHKNQRGYIDGTSLIYLYKVREFNKSPGIKLLPAHLSQLSMINTSFNLACKPLWEPMYLLHMRKGVSFKRDHKPELYKKRYLSYVKNYYDNIRKNLIDQLSLSDIKIHIKQNNSSQYLLQIQSSVESLSIDNPKKIYNVADLLIYHEGGTDTVTLPLRIDHVITNRQKAIYEVGYYTTKSYRLKKKIADIEKIINGL